MSADHNDLERWRADSAVADAKRDAANGDLTHLTELAELYAYATRQWRTWVGIARAMGYEGDGFFQPPPPRLGLFVAGQVEKSRHKVRAGIKANP